MSTEYYPIPKNAVTFGQIKSDVKNGKVVGVTIYGDLEQPRPNEFYLDDSKGNVLGVFKVDGVTFVEYEGNNSLGILQALMRYYGFKIQVEDDPQEYEVADLDNNMMIVGDGSNNEVPEDYLKAFKEGVGNVRIVPLSCEGSWGRPYKYIKSKKTYSKLSRLK